MRSTRNKCVGPARDWTGGALVPADKWIEKEADHHRKKANACKYSLKELGLSLRLRYKTFNELFLIIRVEHLVMTR